jgi:hypothetical protein
MDIFLAIAAPPTFFLLASLELSPCGFELESIGRIRQRSNESCKR